MTPVVTSVTQSLQPHTGRLRVSSITGTLLTVWLEGQRGDTRLDSVPQTVPRSLHKSIISQLMSEYYILVNETHRQYIDPVEFPNRLGITHDAWMTEAHNCLPVYLLTDTDYNMWNDHHKTGNWCGAWAGDCIRLVGETTDDYTDTIDEYRSVSVPVFEDMRPLYAWFPTGDHSTRTETTE